MGPARDGVRPPFFALAQCANTRVCTSIGLLDLWRCKSHVAVERGADGKSADIRSGRAGLSDLRNRIGVLPNANMDMDRLFDRDASGVPGAKPIGRI